MTLNSLLHILYESRHIYDSIMIFGDGGACDNALMELFNQWLPLYRIRVAQNAMCAHVNVTQYDFLSQLHNHFLSFRSLPSSQMLHSSLDINIGGTSEQILRYIAEKGNTAQLAAVHNIDTKFELEVRFLPKKNARIDFQDVPAFQLVGVMRAIGGIADVNKCLGALMPTPQQVTYLTPRTVRLFISSTFRDMHFERAALARYAP